RSCVGGRRAIKQRARCCTCSSHRQSHHGTAFHNQGDRTQGPERAKGASRGTGTIGDPVPSNVELHDMTPELARKVPEAKSHQFYVTADAIVLVSRSDRKVADVIVIK